MPVVQWKGYRPAWLGHGHLDTLYPALFRKVPDVHYAEEKLVTADGDVLVLHWLRAGHPRIAIISHGLEGSSRSPGVLGMARALHKRGWDVLAWNFRSCGGEPNRTPQFYHSGHTGDLEAVIAHAHDVGDYGEMIFVGYSLGANYSLKYVGEQGRGIDPRIICCLAFSAPVDLKASAYHLARRGNALYNRWFLNSIKEKLADRIEELPLGLTRGDLRRIRTFPEFDEKVTAPLHGFTDAETYYAQANSKRVLGAIAIPTLIVNARNDPFLPESCYPVAEAEANPNLFLEIPRTGGHCGFSPAGGGVEYWSEKRALAFLEFEGMGGGA